MPPRPSLILVAFLSTGIGCATGSKIGDLTGGSGGTTVGHGAGGTSTGGTSTTSGTGLSQGGTGGEGGQVVASTCSLGEFAVDIDGDKKLVCAPIDESAVDAINAGCSVYFGWRDECSGCTLPPAKWGFVSKELCVNGFGANDTCSITPLDGQDVRLYGLNLDGDMNADDQLHLGFHCPEPAPMQSPGPCPEGSFATGLDANGLVCTTADVVAIDYVRSSCSLYLGSRDSCDGCTSAPDRWGRVSPVGCANGAGLTNTCSKPSLGGTEVDLFGLNTDGDVDDNDKLYIAIGCVPPAPAASDATDTCPPGQLLAGVKPDGTLACVSAAPAIAGVFKDRCTLYFGWRDSCDACTTAPAKWGRVRDGFCTNDVGVDNTCAPTVLGGATLEMFGLNTDGDVGDDDKLYIAFRCD